VTDLDWGAVDPAALANIVVVQPHFDDAAMGAGYVLMSYPGSTVVTVCGGPPARYPDPPTEWDALGGFRTGDDVVALRREEDAAALALLDARPFWLDFVDHQYLAPDERAPAATVAAALARVIDELDPTAVFVPMGIANPDHALTHEAAMLVVPEREDLTWFCYEDAGYKHLPGLLAWRIGQLFRGERWPTPAMVPVQPDPARKRAAVLAYTSQVPPLERDHALSARLDAHVPEQHWRLARPPAGWERLRDA